MGADSYDTPRLVLTAGGPAFLPPSRTTPHPADWIWPKGMERFAGMTEDEINAIVSAERLHGEFDEGAESDVDVGTPSGEFNAIVDQVDYDRSFYQQYGNPDAAVPSWLQPGLGVTDRAEVIACSVRIGRYYVCDANGTQCYLYLDKEADGWAYQTSDGTVMHLD